MNDIYVPKPSELGYTFGGREPVRDLRPGEVRTVYTEDCFGGVVKAVDDLPTRVCQMPYLNPVTGPFYIHGAEPGDTLAVHILDITPARDWGVSSTFPHFGALTSTHATATLQPPLEERVWRYPIDVAAGTVTFQASQSDFALDLPLAPMHGTVGVAPAGFQAISTITSDVHGGNLDTPELRAGTRLYLPIFVHGGLLADVHYPGSILQGAAKTLNFTEPIGLMMLGILGNVEDYNEARSILDRLVSALPSGSYLVVNDGTNVINPEARNEATRVSIQAGTPYIARHPDQIAGFFHGLELVEPGVVSSSRWRPDTPDEPAEVDVFCGVARKP